MPTWSIRWIVMCSMVKNQIRAAVPGAERPEALLISTAARRTRTPTNTPGTPTPGSYLAVHRTRGNPRTLSRGSSHAGSLAAAAPRPRTRVLMAVHSAERGGAQLVALGQARALRHEFDLVIAVSTGPLRGAFADVAAAIVRGPTSLPIWGASHGRWALQIGRSIPDAAQLARVVRRHQIDVVIVNSTVLVSPVLAARLAGVPVIVHAQEAEVRGRETTVPRARRARAHHRRDLRRGSLRPSTAHPRASW